MEMEEKEERERQEASELAWAREVEMEAEWNRFRRNHPMDSINFWTE